MRALKLYGNRAVELCVCRVKSEPENGVDSDTQGGH